VVRRAASPCGVGKAGFVARPLPVGLEGVVRRAASPYGAGKAWFVARSLPFGLDARHTDGFFSKFTRRVSAESFL
jgi:hypothetical protein